MGLRLRDRSAKGCLRSLEGECWIDRESSGCEFRDARLGDRFRKLLTQIGSAMGQSIPLVCQDWANTKAAYRFFSNDRVSEADILAGHFQSTRDRAAATEGLVLVNCPSMESWMRHLFDCTWTSRSYLRKLY
ncbi:MULTISPECIES: IS4/Tn5 family transposase DNA-binding protein [unclassified Bradyrhizobium]